MTRSLTAIALAAGILLAAATATAGDNRPAGNGGGPADGAFAVPAVALVGPNVTVEDTLVRLGDVFTGLDAKTAGIAAAYAPQAGKRLVLDAQWLSRTARRHNIAWKPAGPSEHIVVQRQSFVVTRGDVEARVRAMLAERMPGAEIAVELFNISFRLHAAGDANDTFAIEDLSYDAGTRRFDAIVAAPAASTMAQRVRVGGRVHKLIVMPVPKRPISKGEVLRADDIETVKLKAEQAPADVVADRAILIGMAAARGLRAGYPIFTRDIERPVLVPKNSLVTLVLQANHMRLTARGKALDPGGLGDVIRVVNEQSKQVVEGTVFAAGQVAIKPFGAVAETRAATN
jgi:flagella basal body P-ring formation protein FlgA